MLADPSKSHPIPVNVLQIPIHAHVHVHVHIHILFNWTRSAVQRAALERKGALSPGMSFSLEDSSHNMICKGFTGR